MKTARYIIATILISFFVVNVSFNIPAKYQSWDYWLHGETLGLSLTDQATTDTVSLFPAVYTANNTLIENAINTIEGTTTNSTITSLTGSLTLSTLVAVGGTGTTTFSGGLYGSLISAPYFHATSSTATSTFEGGIALGGAFSGNAIFLGDIYAPSTLGGRSLTVSGSGIDADSELYTEYASGNLQATTTTFTIATSTETILAKKVPVASTLTGIYCKTFGSGTSTVDVKINGSTSVFGDTPLTCGVDGDGSSSLSGEVASTTLANTTLAAGDYFEASIPDAEPTGSRPRLIVVTPVWTHDD